MIPGVSDPVAAVEAARLCKIYDGKNVIDNLSLTIPVGGVFGLLGPNGAGKTTLMKIMAGLVRPTVGTLTIFGEDAVARKSDMKCKVGLAPQDNNMERELSVEETLTVYGRMFGVPQLKRRVEETIEEFSLGDMRRKVVRTLSGGMMRRALIARTLMPKPELLLLDEPTVGLDPDVRHEIWEIIRNLASAGKTIVLTTHYMDEAEKLCEKIAILKAGRLAFLDTPEGIRNRFGGVDSNGEALETLFIQLAKEGRT
ncbi:MAG TPA: ABC transporter ATP-binding protein [Negativicutes bacterium]|nr:ABC transporter ATP-binding protein [Negativicutes bacterium]